ncbi:sugar phosphate isomerase/epimerase [Virgibacillus necropolis]|uniref:sugar phosphate isomerase/epimerase family protein n=1 Tax=Virgibacillus necropolis TaxID=163877 RepID=UPI0038503BF2
MYKIGLCSVTFRNLTVEQVIKLAHGANMEGIEWGGDFHVPPGDTIRAAEVAELTEQANLEIVSYGSYYRVGHEKEGIPFDVVLETAQRLKAPSIRVWAGKIGSHEIDEKYRTAVVEDARRIAELAEKQDIEINFEYHGGTLTDNVESALLLVNEINHPNIHLYWQPAVGETINKRLKSIEKLSAWLTHIHVFHWNYTDRLSFSEGVVEWEQYLSKLKKDKNVHYLLMEFVKGDNIEQFLKDAKALKNLVVYGNLP